MYFTIDFSGKALNINRKAKRLKFLLNICITVIIVPDSATICKLCSSRQIDEILSQHTEAGKQSTEIKTTQLICDDKQTK
jgi:hypothetical protein